MSFSTEFFATLQETSPDTSNFGSEVRLSSWPDERRGVVSYPYLGLQEAYALMQHKQL